MNRLQVIEEKNLKLHSSPQLQKRQEQLNSILKTWEENPDRFDTNTSPIERLRIQRSKQILSPFLEPKTLKIIDLGCGKAPLSSFLLGSNYEVHALDITKIPLESLDKKISTYVDTLPETKLPDRAFEGVIATDVIASLLPTDFRLFFSECARIAKPSAWLLCSTALDMNSDTAAESFLELLKTEWEIVDIVYSYHNLFLKLKAPAFCVHVLEKITKTLWAGERKSHIIVFAKKKALLFQ